MYGNRNFTRVQMRIPGTTDSVLGRPQSPFVFSSWLLAAYIFSIVVLSKNPDYHNFSQYIGFGLACAFAVDLLVYRYVRPFLPKEFKSLWLFLGLMFLSTLWASSNHLALTRSLTFFQLLVFATIAVNILVARRSMLPVAIGFLAGILWTVLEAFHSTGLVPELSTAFYSRIYSVQENPNLYAIFLIIGCLVAWYLVRRSSNKLVRLLLMVLMFLSVYQVVFFTGSRKGYFAILWLCCGYLLARQLSAHRVSISRFILTVLFIIAFIFLAFELAAQVPFIDERIKQLPIEIAEGTRAEMIRFGIRLWLQRPFLGHGASQYQAHFFGYYSHNNYIELLANQGIIGIILYYSFYFALLSKYIRLYRQGELQPDLMAWLMVFSSLLLVWDIGMVSYYEKSFWVAFVILVSFAYIKSDAMISVSKQSKHHNYISG